jgi:hypothetical protein
MTMTTTTTTKQTRNHQSKLQQPVNIVHWTPMDNASRRLQLDIRSVDKEVQFWGKRTVHATTMTMATTTTTKQTRNHQSKLQQPVNIVHWIPMDNVSRRLQLDFRSADHELQFWKCHCQK